MWMVKDVDGQVQLGSGEGQEKRGVCCKYPTPQPHCSFYERCSLTNHPQLSILAQ